MLTNLRIDAHDVRGKNERVHVVAILTTYNRQPQCKACESGCICLAGAAAPDPCPKGTEPNADATECRPCDAGRFQGDARQPQCKTCDASQICPAGTAVPDECPTHARAGRAEVLCEPDYFAITDVFVAVDRGGDGRDKWEGLACERLDAIAGLQVSSAGSRPRGCAEEVPLFLERNFSLYSSEWLPWCEDLPDDATSCSCTTQPPPL